MSKAAKQATVKKEAQETEVTDNKMDTVEDTTEAPPPAAETKTAGKTAGKKRKAPEPGDDEVTMATLKRMKRKICEVATYCESFNLSKKQKRILREIGSKSPTAPSVDDLYQDDLKEMYTRAQSYEKLVDMVQCVLFYRDHHNIVVSPRDQRTLDRALSHTKDMDITKIQKLYDFYIGIFESNHRYFERSKRKEKTKLKDAVQEKRKVKKDQRKKTKYVGYNVFIQDAWKERGEAFKAMAAENKNTTEVIKLLGEEWKTSAELRAKYKAKADEMNAKLAEAATPEVAATPTAQASN